MSINLDLMMLKQRNFILDGAMGTMLQEKGMQPGECPEMFGINHASVLSDIHKQYVEAGADIIETNTFGANRYKLAEYGLGNRTQEINTAAVQIARQAAGSHALVAGSIGPTGKMLKPMGDLDFDDMFTAFQEQMAACEKAGADLISIETMTDIGEMRAALAAAKHCTRLPVIAHMTFEKGGCTMMGTDPLTALIIMEAFNPLAIGANCSGGAGELLPVIALMNKYTSCYLSVEPNAGLPRLIGGDTVFPDSPESMAEYALKLRDAGANIIGGCCGTTPAHIQAIAGVIKGLAPVKRTNPKVFALASRSKNIILGSNQPLAFIGERINPTARKKLAQNIKEGHMEMVIDEARRQAASGAPVLDVNMGVPGIDEPRAMKQAIVDIQNAIDVPVSIDSTNPQAVEEGLKNFVGRALINSTTGEDKQLDIILPLASKYGAAVLGLCLDEKGIPERADDRVAIARHIYQRAREYGLRNEDIYIDCLVKTASAEQSQVMETIKALRKVKEEIEVGTVLGVSNVSHGLPAREILNSAYLAMAYAAGLDFPILNPFDQRMMDMVRAAGVLLNRDNHCNNYIGCYRDYKAINSLRHPICEQCNIPGLLQNINPVSAAESTAANRAEENQDISTYQVIRKAVLEGNRDGIGNLVQTALEEGKDPLELVNQALIPGIEEAGELYDKKQYFLPQLMMAAEAMKKAFAVVKPHLKENGKDNSGVIVMATVEGDIHDIGKNIVCVLLENYGFKIFDLGKDVPAQTILDRAQQEKADIIGLSALMTTTMPRMKEVIEGVKKRGLKCRVMVGGAVLNQEYAEHIGADAYSEDAREAVQVAHRLMQRFL
ncbi:MAG TPA: homocysteine S-methyltransferase family protein [Syntrophomonadaceae bacterium]|nr:homocysteine S-methyltransferase family protein [Syntrophomonadaceae bacterium]